MLSVGVYIAFVITCLPFLYLCVRGLRPSWDSKNDQVYEALRSPSVRNARNAFDRRVALAIREAKQGFRVCSGCHFTNSVRATSCVMCGMAMPPESRSFLPWKKPQDDAQTKLASATASALVPTTSRQRRVRRRKEWMRQVDNQGRVHWQHTIQGTDGGQSEVSFPSFVLETKKATTKSSAGSDTVQAPEPLVQALPKRAEEATTHNEGPGHVTINVDTPDSDTEAETEVPEVTLTDVTALLEGELKTLMITLVDASDPDVDPSRVAFSSTSDTAATQSTQSVVDAATVAKLDFPSKLAQLITSMASLFTDVASGVQSVCRISIERDALIADSIKAIATMDESQLRAPIRVTFAGEQGIDAGGVYREWFLLLNEKIVAPEVGIFSCVDQQEQTFYLNPNSREMLGEDHLAHYLAVGRLLGRALLDGNVTGFHLALPLLKIILGLPVGFDDLEYFDPETHKNLKWLLENDGVDMLGLDFTVVEKLSNGKIRSIDLVPGGSEIDVTDHNKRQFVDRKLQYLLFESVESQLFALLRGIYEVIPAELLMVFDAEELDYVLSGSDEIDVDDWEAHTLPSKSMALHPAYFNFWRVVRELNNEERRRLLQFSTGSTRVPPGGFSALTSNDGRLCLFSLNGVRLDATRGYLHSHACFNRLDVPMHRDLKVMREAVHAAISSDMVGFTTA